MSQLPIVDAPPFFGVAKAYILLGVLSTDSNFHQRPLVDFDLEIVFGSIPNHVFHSEVAHHGPESVAFSHLDHHRVGV